MDQKILVLTDNDDCKIVRSLLKKRIFPITRSSILSSVDLLKHIDIKYIILDKSHKYVDTLEFILNVRDINNNVFIYVPSKYKKYKEWDSLKTFNDIEVYDDYNLLDNQIKQLIKKRESNKTNKI